jgi:hypothetical protein
MYPKRFFNFEKKIFNTGSGGGFAPERKMSGEKWKLVPLALTFREGPPRILLHVARYYPPHGRAFRLNITSTGATTITFV